MANGLQQNHNSPHMFNKRLQNDGVANRDEVAMQRDGTPPHRVHNREGEAVRAQSGQTMEEIQKQTEQIVETKLENQGVYQNANQMKHAASMNPAFMASQQEALKASRDAMKAHESDTIMRDATASVATSVLGSIDESQMFAEAAPKNPKSKSEFGIEESDTDIKQTEKRLSMEARPERPGKVLNHPVKTDDTAMEMPTHETKQEDVIKESTPVTDKPIDDKQPVDEAPIYEEPENPVEEKLVETSQVKHVPSYMSDNSNISPDMMADKNTRKFIISGKKNSSFADYLGKHSRDIAGYVGDELGITDENILNQNVYISPAQQFKNTTSCVLIYSGFDGVDLKNTEAAVRKVVQSMLKEHGEANVKLGAETYPVTKEELNYCKEEFADKQVVNNYKTAEPENNSLDPSLERGYDASMDEYYAQMANDMQMG